jgi:hypothetical protein
MGLKPFFVISISSFGLPPRELVGKSTLMTHYPMSDTSPAPLLSSTGLSYGMNGGTFLHTFSVPDSLPEKQAFLCAVSGMA